MKKFFKGIILFSLCAVLTACSGSPATENSKYKSYGMENFTVKKYEDTNINVVNYNIEYDFDCVETFIIDRSEDWRLIIDDKRVSMPEDVNVFNYSQFKEFADKYNLDTKFTEEDKTYMTMFTSEIANTSLNVIAIKQTNDLSTVYYTENFHPLAPDYKSKIIVIKLDNKDVKYERVLYNDQFEELSDPNYSMTEYKPVIYVYDEKERDVNITLKKENNKKVWLEYPVSNNGTWNIKTSKNGNIVYNNRNYNYLYWEDKENLDFKFDEGFCIKGEDTALFLEYALSELNLSENEADDFITYWLPKMVDNKYNIIKFNPKEFDDMYALVSSPKADNMINVYMIFKESNEEIDLEPQNLSAFNNFERNGLTIVQWGGSEIK